MTRIAPNFVDLIGKTYNRLTVIARSENNKKGEAMWLCECSCPEHNRTIVRSSDLKSGNTKSCGCYRDERIAKYGKRYNAYEIIDDYVIGTTFNDDNFYVDKKNFDKIKSYCWCVNGMGYLTTTDPSTRKKITLHRLILGFPSLEFDIDHINRNKLDNRESNLRIVKHHINSSNVSKRKTNKSGFMGVKITVSKTWIAQMKYNKEVVLDKTFKNKEDAIIARLQAELKYFGIEFAPQRHLFEEYNII
jgi:hypothetical protein